MRKRRVYICGPRDGIEDTTEMNGLRRNAMRANNFGWIVNHAGMVICRGKMATRKKADTDFPTSTVTTTDADENDGE